MQNKMASNGLHHEHKKINGTQKEIKVDKRNFFQVALIDLQNFIYFFAPLVFIHLAALLIKPYITSDARGPWEILWNKFVDIFGEDRYQYYVWGSLIVSTIFYWCSAGIYALMDFTQM